MSRVLIPDSLAGVHAQGTSLVGTVRLHLKEVSTRKTAPTSVYDFSRTLHKK